MSRENYSSFKYFDAWTADLISDAQGDQAGNTIDMRGYNAVTVAFNVASLASAGAMGANDLILVILQHGLASAAGVSAWSIIPNSQLINSVYGGYDSTGETGIFASLASTTDVTAHSEIFFTGYKKDTLHRYLRILVRNSDAASAGWAAGVAILGEPDTWAVNESI